MATKVPAKIDNSSSDTFTPGTDLVSPIGGVVDDVATDLVQEGRAGAARITQARGLHVSIRDEDGNEVGSGSANHDLLAKLDLIIEALPFLLQDDTLTKRGVPIAGGRLDGIRDAIATLLPPGAATAARQVAGGASGTPSPEVQSIQGTDAMVPVRVTMSDILEKLDQIRESLAFVMQDDTLTKRGIGISGGTLDGIASPVRTLLPDGAATSIRQAAPGSIDMPSTEVSSVQGVLGMAPLRTEMRDLETIESGASDILAAILDELQVQRARAVPHTVTELILSGRATLYSREWQFTAAQTDLELFQAPQGQRIAVTKCTVDLDADQTNSSLFRVCLTAAGQLTIPAVSATTGVDGIVAAHGDAPPGGGVIEGDGGAFIGIGSSGGSLRITTEVATSGRIHVLVSWVFLPA